MIKRSLMFHLFHSHFKRVAGESLRYVLEVLDIKNYSLTFGGKEQGYVSAEHKLILDFRFDFFVLLIG